jgi:hypothetical protein
LAKEALVKNLPGVNNNAEPPLCMVVDCGKVALYRNKSASRGYCARHKHLAVRASMRSYDEDRTIAAFNTHRDSQ